jgi:CubicO group peptidase (beta-lactamase class C family)
MPQAENKLTEFIEATAAEFGIPGLAVGIWADGREVFATAGVTSLDNPLPVTPETLFTLGSVSKPVTATALMRLVADGRVELDAPVRRYVPELVLPDEEAAAEITVMNLLNHTAGLDWRIIVDTGEGDDALTRFVAKLAELDLVAKPNTRASYSQAGYNLIGRIIEKVTGLTFEQAVAELVFEPLGMAQSTYSLNAAMVQRFAVGHNADDEGNLVGARQWKDNRANNPGGGIASSVADQLRLARFHLGDGRAPDGTPLLSTELLDRMKEPTVELRGTSLGDALGICWFLRDVGGVRTVGHGGSANGQFAELLLVPERNLAIAVASNANPGGIPANQAIVRWALETYLGVVEADPEPLPYDAARAAEIVGRYENDAMTVDIAADGSALTIECLIKPEIRAASDRELPQDLEPAGFGLLPGDSDDYIVTDGALAGQRGFFTRDGSGAIVAVDLAGRKFDRVAAA